MPFMSSPVAYPPSSSPPEQAQPRKRLNTEDGHNPKPKKRLFGKSLFEPVEPLRTINANATRQTENPQEKVVDELPRWERNAPAGDSKDVAQISLPSPAGSTRTRTWREPPCADAQTDTEPSTLDSSLTTVRTSSGKRYVLRERVVKPSVSYEQTIAQRSHTDIGRATKSYYGINIHELLNEANEINSASTLEEPVAIQPVVRPTVEQGKTKKRNRMLWAEKYRAKKFTDLVGDERTHRTVLRWLKGWDSIVFPGSVKPTIKGRDQEEEGKVHRKILLLTGSPGLGKTTLAHVCAKQAGYEVVEINASDERSRDVVKGRIRDCVGTENVRGANSKIGDKTVRKAGRPVCVVVDEVDGVIGGSGGSGDGGFMRALIDLVLLDQKNASRGATGTFTDKSKKGDCFRLLRPIILICNDVYHTSLRPLRSSNLAEIVHVRKPPLDKMVARLKHVFEKEAVPADSDGVRRLCEATWGISSRKEDRGGSNSGEGDVRAVLVAGEWAAGKLRASKPSSTVPRLTRQWFEKHMLADLSSTSNSTASRGLGRGGAREAADRVFLDNAGFPKSATAPTKSNFKDPHSPSGPSSATDATRARCLDLLRSVVDTAGDTDRIVEDVFTAYPSRNFHDDTLLSKPNMAADWLAFHDTLSSRVHGASQAFELGPYLSTSVLAFHTLFASAKTSLQNSSSYNDDEAGDAVDTNPFSGPRADFIAFEQTKATKAQLTGLQSSLSIPLARGFRSPEQVATDLVPYLHRMLSPAVAPVLVGGSGGVKTASVRRDTEKAMVKRAVSAMGATGIELEKMRVEEERAGSGGWVYRMEP